MSKRVMKHSAAESLEKLRDVISSVNKQCRSRHDIIVTFLYSDYIEVIFQCMVEFDYRNADNQIGALRKLDCLADYLMEHKPNGFYMHTGKRTIRTGNKITADDRIVDLTLSKTGAKGGFVFSMPKLGISKEQSSKSRAGIIVACRHPTPVGSAD